MGSRRYRTYQCCRCAQTFRVDGKRRQGKKAVFLLRDAFSSPCSKNSAYSFTPLIVLALWVFLALHPFFEDHSFVWAGGAADLQVHVQLEVIGLATLQPTINFSEEKLGQVHCVSSRPRLTKVRAFHAFFWL